MGFFANCDAMGVAPTLKVKKRKKHGTVFGGCISLWMTLLTLILLNVALVKTFVGGFIDWDLQHSESYLAHNNTQVSNIAGS